MRTASLLLAGVLLVGSASAVAQTRPPEAKQWAVLIGVQKHQDAGVPNLRYTVHDVRALRKFLVERARMPESHVVEIRDPDPDDSADKPIPPTRANILAQLQALKDKVKKEDRVVVFFSGHGVRDGAGDNAPMFLVPHDFQKAQIAATGIPISAVRDALAACQGATKFLVLDCCHAGSDKAVNPTLSPETLAKSIDFSQVPNFYLLASCQAQEQSQEWPARKQGVFTYWLCRALEGGADADGNGEVTVQETQAYVLDRVRETAEHVEQKPQTPVTLPRNSQTVVLSLLPERPKSLCRRMAEHLDLELRRQKMKKVMVVEFTEQGLAGTDRPAQVNLPFFCSREIRQELTALAASDYQVLTEDASKRVFHKGIKVEAIRQPSSIPNLPDQADGLVIGNLKPYGRNNVLLHCQVFQVANDLPRGASSGVLPLNAELVAEAEGLSGDFRPVQGTDQYSGMLLQKVRQQAEQANPLSDPKKFKFPYVVEIYTAAPGANPAWRRQELHAGGAENQTRHVWFEAKKGERLRIRIRNHAESHVGAVILVDGMGLMGKQPALIENAQGFLVRKAIHSDFDNWYVPKNPGVRPRPGEVVEYVSTELIFTDVAESVAAGQGFAGGIGEVTVAFYSNAKDDRDIGGIGVGEGQRRDVDLKTATEYQWGKLLGVFHIRYAEKLD